MITDTDKNLIRAAAHGDVDLVCQCLDSGANINARWSCGETALIWAAANDHPACIDVLLSHGADSTLAELVNGSTALMVAAYWNHEECCHLLANRSFTLDARDHEGRTALDISRLRGSVKCAHILERAVAERTLNTENTT